MSLLPMLPAAVLFHGLSIIPRRSTQANTVLCPDPCVPRCAQEMDSELYDKEAAEYESRTAGKAQAAEVAAVQWDAVGEMAAAG